MSVKKQNFLKKHKFVVNNFVVYAKQDLDSSYVLLILVVRQHTRN